MAKLRFIKPWGPYKPGDLHEPGNANTVRMLVEVYKFAVLEPDVPVIPKTTPPPVRDLYKYVRKPQRDKMVYGAPKVKKEDKALDEI